LTVVYVNKADAAINTNPDGGINVRDLTNGLNNVCDAAVVAGEDLVNENKVEPYVGRKTQIVLKSTGNKPLVLPMSQLKKRKFSIEEKFFFPKAIQTEITSEELDLLFMYYKDAVDERNELLLKISTLVIDVKYFENNDKKTRFYTGLTTWKLLNALFKLVEPFLPEHGNAKLSPFQMLVLTLMKLRLNLTFTDLGYRFQIETNTASNYFHRCIFILFQLFHNSKLVHWPQERSQLLFNTPSYFRCAFKEVITIIVDCFEIFIERPSVLRALAQAWSNYKHHVTLKYLIGISTTGVIIFISEGFGGRTSDKSACVLSGFLDQLQEGDVVLADKGFLIEKEVEEKGASLKLPCFVKNGGQLKPTEVEDSRQVANLRIHVERVISVLRQKYNMCSDHATMTTISKQNDLFDNDLFDKIVFVCCCLVNMCPSVVRHDFEI